MNAITQPPTPQASGKRSIEDLRGDRRPPEAVRARPSTNGVQVVPELSLPSISVGFGNLQSWEFTQRVARALATSTMVPEQYRALVPNKRKRDELLENPNAIANCIVALNIANRVREDVLMVMQNLHVIEGRPSWASPYIIGKINACGEFSSRLKFRFEDRGKKTVEHVTWQWSEEDRAKVPQVTKFEIQDVACTAYATEKSTGEVIEGDTVSMEMAVQEGWYSKNGSKWRTMAPTMLRYRAAAFFGRTNTPDLLMGMQTSEETYDILDAEQADTGEWQVSADEEGRAKVVDHGADAQDTAGTTREPEQQQTNAAASDQGDSGEQDNAPTEQTTQDTQEQPSDGDGVPSSGTAATGADDHGQEGRPARRRRSDAKVDQSAMGFGNVD